VEIAMAEGRLADSVLKGGSRAWRRLMPASLRGLAQPVMAAVVERRVASALAMPRPQLKAGPLVVSGFFSESRGISEGARLTVAGLRHAGFNPLQHDLRPVISAGPGVRPPLAFDPGGVWLIHANAPEAMHALAYLDPNSWIGRYRIGYWVWELERIPGSWARAARAFDEIWTPSSFVADALKRSGMKTPVRVMPHPVSLVPPEKPDRAMFQISQDDFVVLAMGDLRSSLARKNLLGAVEAYRRAFPEAGLGRRMIVKVQSSDPHCSIDRAVKEATAGRGDVVWLTDTLSTIDAHKLIASCDVFLSPHRSEGFGLPMAEAFMAGVPALGTGWSGNLDFMGGVPELQIAHRMVPVRDPYGVYKRVVQRWAEPDIGDAAAKLRNLADFPDRRGKLVARGRAGVEALARAWSGEALAGTELERLAAK
jgi:glycosyltransferase involved in cell wall biosynthesis